MPDPQTPRPEIEALLVEGRTFVPDHAFVAGANAAADLYDEAERDPEALWAALARERISWFTPFETTLADATVVEAIRDNTGKAED